MFGERCGQPGQSRLFESGNGLFFRAQHTWRTACNRSPSERRSPISEHEPTSFQAVRDLDVWGQPGFWIYQAPFHRCSRCDNSQHLIPPFKRKDTAYTYRFEQFVLRSLIGSTAEEV